MSGHWWLVEEVVVVVIVTVKFYNCYIRFQRVYETSVICMCVCVYVNKVFNR